MSRSLSVPNVPVTADDSNAAARKVESGKSHNSCLSTLIPNVLMTDPDVNMTDAPAAAAGSIHMTGSAANMPSTPRGPRARRPGDAQTFSVHGFQRRLRHYSD